MFTLQEAMNSFYLNQYSLFLLQEQEKKESKIIDNSHNNECQFQNEKYSTESLTLRPFRETEAGHVITRK